MNRLEDKEMGERGPITSEEIEAIKAKHAGILKTIRKTFWDVLDMGDWFIEAQKRVGTYHRGAGWQLWLRENFSDAMTVLTVARYMRLAANRQFLIGKLESMSAGRTFDRQEDEFDRIPSIHQALQWITDREEAEGKGRKKKVIDVEASASNGAAHSEPAEPPGRAIPIPPPPEVQVELEERGEEVENPDQEPLVVLRDRLKSYVIQRYQLQYLEAEILELIRLAELSAEQIEQCVEWACREHPEVRGLVLESFKH